MSKVAPILPSAEQVPVAWGLLKVGDQQCSFLVLVNHHAIMKHCSANVVQTWTKHWQERVTDDL